MPIARSNPAALESHAFTQRRFFTIVVLASVPIVLAIAIFLATRRASGSIHNALPTVQLVATAFVMGIWICLSRIAGRCAPGGPERDALRTEHWVLQYMPWVSLLLVAYACSIPAARLIDWLVWPATIAAAWFGPRWLTVYRSVRPARRSLPTSDAVSQDDQLLQQVSRYRTADGLDMIRGTLLAEFAPGQRTATIYVAFCPPFERLPHVDAESEDANVASVKQTQVLHNGAQFEVRLAHRTGAQLIVPVEFFASENRPD